MTDKKINLGLAAEIIQIVSEFHYSGRPHADALVEVVAQDMSNVLQHFLATGEVVYPHEPAQEFPYTLNRQSVKRTVDSILHCPFHRGWSDEDEVEARKERD